VPERTAEVIAFAVFMLLTTPPNPNELSIKTLLDSPLLDETLILLLFKEARRAGLTEDPNFPAAWVPPFR
jgi:hypothetical protein